MPGTDLSLLDVGGGTGELAATARGHKRHRVDQDRRSRRTLWDGAEAASHTFTLCRIEEFSTDEQFDAILALNLIEHVSAPREILARSPAS